MYLTRNDPPRYVPEKVRVIAVVLYGSIEDVLEVFIIDEALGVLVVVADQIACPLQAEEAVIASYHGGRGLHPWKI